MGLTDDDIDDLLIIRRVFCSISLVVVISVIIAAIIQQKHKFPTTKFIFFLGFSTILRCVFSMIALSDDGAICNLQAFMLSFADWTFSLWICAIALNLWLMVVKKLANVGKFMKWYHLLVWGFGGFMSIVPFFGTSGVYGPAGAWCWIPSKYPYWRFGVWYGPMIFIWLFVTVMYGWVAKVLFSKEGRFYERDMTEAKTRRDTYVKLSRYPLVFILFWVFPLVNRLQNWISGNDGVLWLTAIHSILVSTLGMVICLVFAFDEDIPRNCTKFSTKQGLEVLFSKRSRKSAEPQRYAMQYDSDEENEEAKLEKYIIKIDNSSNIWAVKESNPTEMIFVQVKDLNGAIEGDIVHVKVQSSEEKKYAIVKEVIQPTPRTVTGLVAIDLNGNAWLMRDDKQPVFIQEADLNTAKHDDIVKAELLPTRSDGKYTAKVLDVETTEEK